MESNIFNWQDTLVQTYQAFSEQIITFAPILFGAVMLLLLGWLIAYVLSKAAGKLVTSFDTVFKRTTKSDVSTSNQIKRSYATIISRVVFWIVMLFFITAAANMLGWQMFSTMMASIIAYLPNIVIGLVIILAGILLSQTLRSGVVRAAKTAGIAQSEFFARGVQIVIIFTVIVIGIEQIGINVGFITNVLIVTLGVLLAGGALAFSLGAKTFVANIIGAQNLRKHCQIGEYMQLGDAAGTIIDITHTSIILDTPNGRTVVPAQQFLDHASIFVSYPSDIESSDMEGPKNE